MAFHELHDAIAVNFGDGFSCVGEEGLDEKGKFGRRNFIEVHQVTETVKGHIGIGEDLVHLAAPAPVKAKHHPILALPARAELALETDAVLEIHDVLEIINAHDQRNMFLPGDLASHLQYIIIEFLIELELHVKFIIGCYAQRQLRFSTEQILIDGGNAFFKSFGGAAYHLVHIIAVKILLCADAEQVEIAEVIERNLR
jgi:hypothetical protein